MGELKGYFDILLDVTYLNNRVKSVLADFYIDISEGILKKYLVEPDNLLLINPVLATSQKPRAAPNIHNDNMMTNKKIKLV